MSLFDQYHPDDPNPCQENERHVKERSALTQALGHSNAELQKASASKHNSADGKLVLVRSSLITLGKFPT
jgi:hypothetical protein